MTIKAPDQCISESYVEAMRRLKEIETLCKRHNNPSVVTSTQILAAKVLKIIEGTK